MEKDSIQSLLLEIGRQIVREKGNDALTVRKLSEASGCSVGLFITNFPIWTILLLSKII